MKIMPYVNTNWTKQSMLLMEEKDSPVEVQEDEAINQLVQFKDSYFWNNDTFQIFPRFKFNEDTAHSLVSNQTESFCLHLWWRNQTRDKIYPDYYKNVSE